ncbi:MAG TPA: oxidoreductase [Acidimicrobiales bacterium]|nr:oxidoreductase [Acidimicrobiales bacterium]
MPWTLADVPDLEGLTVVVTGANAGIGLETAAAVAGAGATVVLACRNLDKATAARAEIESRRPRGHVEVLRLDLASQAQIADAAAEAIDRFPRIDRLINNAGVMSTTREETEDGFELLLGTNHLGHFAFTGRILPAVLAAPRSRVVTVTSLSQGIGRIRWDDLHLERSYRQATAYAQSKLACVKFAFALQRRLAIVGEDTASLAAHPGFAATDILQRDRFPRLAKVERRVGERFIQTPAEACRSSVRAATDPAAHGGQLYGPAHRFQTEGPPIPVRPPRRALDEEAQDRLWELSAELTGVEYALPQPGRRAAQSR